MQQGLQHKMIRIILLTCFLHGTYAGYKGASLTCECTTTHCLEHHMEHCNTTGVCFSQYFDRHDGSHPVVRGCIRSKTPLLCENRRPAVIRGTWPLLLCCNSNLCNRDAIPTAPPWFEQQNRENSSVMVADEQFSDNIDITKTEHEFKDTENLETSLSNHRLSPVEDPPIINVSSRTKSRSSLPHIISPIYISVLVLGIISLIIIGIVATMVLRSSNRFYVEQYGALEQQHEQCCLKHANEQLQTTVHMTSDFDSQVELLNNCSHAYIHVIHQTQDSNNT